MSTVRLDEVLTANRLVYYCVLIIHHLVHCHWLLQLLELVSPSLGESSAADVCKCWWRGGGVASSPGSPIFSNVARVKRGSLVSNVTYVTS